MLEICELNKKYNSDFTLKNISLHIKEGDFVLLFGPDDAGKTSLLYQILGLHHFSEGEILFQGNDVRHLSKEEQRQIRFVPDSVCMEQVRAKDYFRTLSRLYPEYDEEDVADLCEYFGVDTDCKLTEMTYNENKLTMIIGAMVTGPKLLILDEPLNFMTIESGKKLLGFLKYLSSRGIAILITSDTSKDIWEYCTRYVYMQDGMFATEGFVSDVYDMQKAVTLPIAYEALAQSLLGSAVARRNNKVTFIYDKKKHTRSLMGVLELIGTSEVEIEALTLEEIMEKDYTRWM